MNDRLLSLVEAILAHQSNLSPQHKAILTKVKNKGPFDIDDVWNIAAILAAVAENTAQSLNEAEDVISQQDEIISNYETVMDQQFMLNTPSASIYLQ